MSPSLQCGWDQLKFRAVGPGASQFAVEQVPSTCGYSIQRNSLALVMLVPYDGCNVVQEVGSYVLPMHWQGSPVSLWCPKPPAPTTVQSAATAPLPFYPPQALPYFFPPYPINPQYPTREPETTTPMALPEQPQDAFNPRSFNRQYKIPEPGQTMTPPPTVPERRGVHFPQYFFDPQYPFYPQYPTLKLEMTTPPPKARPNVHVPRYPFHFQYPTRKLEMPTKACPERPRIHFPRRHFIPEYPTRELEMITTPPKARRKRPSVHFPRSFASPISFQSLISNS
ncbi:hypothetical protein EPR50_G00122660 [Perca flavescens]|uniref:ZP domain-containing protein n=1 Tax=Perca flavescens TaxID=8167 RepID=A0A484CTI6_PERFV|nr:hypothetical protein EPR50_G00122660 [Perca flavescens]